MNHLTRTDIPNRMLLAARGLIRVVFSGLTTRRVLTRLSTA